MKTPDNYNSENILEIRDLTVHYESEGSKVHAVNHVSLSLEKGKCLGLVGETGAGKTTIAKTILQILPPLTSHIDSGEILFEKQDLLKEKEDSLRKVRGDKIAMIFQDPMTSLNPVKKVGEQISEVIRLHSHISRAEAIEKGKDMLEMVGIPRERYGEYPLQFSGGMKQRVVIAMAIACNPDLLLADEPTTALDVTIQAQILRVLRSLLKELHSSMILITHDLGVVAQNCDTVAVIYAGEIVEYGTKEQVFRNPQHPYTIGLFGALPDLNKEVHRLSPIEGMPADPTNLPEGCFFHPRCSCKVDDCLHSHPEMVEVESGHFVRCCRNCHKEG